MSENKNKKMQNKAAAGKAARQNMNLEKSAAKKAAILEPEKKSRLPLFALIACAALIMGAAYHFIPGSNPTNATVSSTPSAHATASMVTYPANLFDDGRARHFEFKNNEITIKYFIVKSSDGVIRAAYDACDVCWPAGKGYYQEGDVMVCRNCGRRFASNQVNEVQGGCNPAPLNRTVENGQVRIQVKDILGGIQYFNFSGKV